MPQPPPNHTYKNAGEILGAGTYGTVYVKKDNPDRVVKIINNEDIYYEYDALRMCVHPNVIKLLSSEIDGDTFTVFTFPRFDTDLFKFMRDPTFTQLPHKMIMGIVRQIASGVAAMHNNQYFHRDIKPDNIFYNNHTNHVVIADLGLAKRYIPGRINTFPVCAESYRPPELLIDMDDKYTPAIDVFSLGLVLYELVVRKGCIFYSNNNESAARRRMIRHYMNQTRLKEYTKELKLTPLSTKNITLIMSMLLRTAGSRPSMEIVCDILNTNN